MYSFSWLSALALLLPFVRAQSPVSNGNALWYTSVGDPNNWEQTQLPIGNGYLSGNMYSYDPILFADKRGSYAYIRTSAGLLGTQH